MATIISPPMNVVVTPHKNACTKSPSLKSVKKKPGPGPVRFKPAFSFSPYSHRHRRVYARPSSHITTSTLGTHKNPFDLDSHTSFISYLEQPWWGSTAMPREHLGREEFAYHTEMALDVATAAESSLEAAEIHLKRLLKEEELSVQVLKNEIDVVRTRSRAARHQVASLRAALQSEGIPPKSHSDFVALLDDEDGNNNSASPQTISAGPSADSANESPFRE